MTAARWVVGLAIGVSAAVARVPAQPEIVGRIERLDPRLDAVVAPGAALERVADGPTAR